MNKVFLIGRLTRDPELRYTGANTAVATFSLAISRTYSNSAGERTTDYVNIVVWRKQAENVKNYLSQGSQVAIDGRIQSRTYDAPDGKKRYITEIVADNIEFLGSRPGSRRQVPNANNESSEENNQAPEPTPYDFEIPIQEEEAPSFSGTDTDSNPFADFGASIEIDDNELPF